MNVITKIAERHGKWKSISTSLVTFPFRLTRANWWTNPARRNWKNSNVSVNVPTEDAAHTAHGKRNGFLLKPGKIQIRQCKPQYHRKSDYRNAVGLFCISKPINLKEDTTMAKSINERIEVAKLEKEQAEARIEELLQQQKHRSARTEITVSVSAAILWKNGFPTLRYLQTSS